MEWDFAHYSRARSSDSRFLLFAPFDKTKILPSSSLHRLRFPHQWVQLFKWRTSTHNRKRERIGKELSLTETTTTQQKSTLLPRLIVVCQAIENKILKILVSATYALHCIIGCWENEWKQIHSMETPFLWSSMSVHHIHTRPTMEMESPHTKAMLSMRAHVGSLIKTASRESRVLFSEKPWDCCRSNRSVIIRFLISIFTLLLTHENVLEKLRWSICSRSSNFFERICLFVSHFAHPRLTGTRIISPHVFSTLSLSLCRFHFDHDNDDITQKQADVNWAGWWCRINDRRSRRRDNSFLCDFYRTAALCPRAVLSSGAVKQHTKFVSRQEESSCVDHISFLSFPFSYCFWTFFEIEKK